MGTYLSTPLTDKESSEGGADGIVWGASSMQGWRMNMEDAHLVEQLDPSTRTWLFAVFDGHGGPEVAQLCASQFSQVLTSTEGFTQKDLGKALSQAFLEMDAMLKREDSQRQLEQLAKAGKGAQQARGGPEPDLSVDDLAVQTGLSAQSIKDYVLEVLQKGAAEENGSDENEDGGEQGAGTAEAGDRKSPSPVVVKKDDGAVTSLPPSASLSSVPAGDSRTQERRDGKGPACAGSSSSKRKKKSAKRKGGRVGNGSASGAAEEGSLDGLNLLKIKDQLLNLRPGYDSGTTAVVAVLQGKDTLVVANAGDSRCVVSHGGQAVEMSVDHKPGDPEELSRIEGAGGSVQDGRVEGNLNLSRAIGDHNFKLHAELPPERQMITAMPDVRTMKLQEEDVFMVIACDGIWNVMNSQEVVDYIHERLEQQVALSKICEEICDKCLDEEMADDSDGSGCDNMTILIIAFYQGQKMGQPEAAFHAKGSRIRKAEDVPEPERDGTSSKQLKTS